MYKMAFYIACLTVAATSASAPFRVEAQDTLSTPIQVQTRSAGAEPRAADEANEDRAAASHPGDSADDSSAYIDFSIRATTYGPRPYPVGGVLLEFGLGALGIGLGTGLTMGLFAAGFAFNSGGLLLTGVSIGALFTFGLADTGIVGGGKLTGGHGSDLWTALGILIGGGAGAALGLGLVPALTHADGRFSDASAWATTLLIPTLALTGGIVAYEVSDRGARRRRAEQVSLMPVAMPRRGGLSLGLAGRF